MRITSRTQDCTMSSSTPEPPDPAPPFLSFCPSVPLAQLAVPLPVECGSTVARITSSLISMGMALEADSDAAAKRRGRVERDARRVVVLEVLVLERQCLDQDFVVARVDA